ncbi:hypothetical protein [Promicromonospora sp. NPDC050262]|uniref:hypothetical protein n=1 Tax=Promicromonospora sp. NPDC050262 TaxID=3155036 RepID=UPI00340EF23D
MSSSVTFRSTSAGRGSAEHRSVIIGEVAIERVKSVVVVIKGIDEQAAEEVLGDVAARAGVPLRTASTQVLATLQTRAGSDGLTQDTLDRALDEVAPESSPGPRRVAHAPQPRVRRVT